MGLWIGSGTVVGDKESSLDVEVVAGPDCGHSFDRYCNISSLLLCVGEGGENGEKEEDCENEKAEESRWWLWGGM